MTSGVHRPGGPDRGFRGRRFEANSSRPAPSSTAPLRRPKTMGGQPRRVDRAAPPVRGGKRAGLRVDTIYTPGWSAGTHGVTRRAWLGEGDRLRLCLARRRGQLPGRGPEVGAAGVTKRTLQGVVAYRCDRTAPAPAPTSRSWSRTAPWTWPPRWTVTASPGPRRRARRAPATSSSPPGCTAPARTSGLAGHRRHHLPGRPLRQAGFEAIKGYTENEVMTPALREAMRRSGGSLFFDSLELNRRASRSGPGPPVPRGVPAAPRLLPGALPGRRRGHHPGVRLHRRARRPHPRGLQPDALRPVPRQPPPAAEDGTRRRLQHDGPRPGLQLLGPAPIDISDMAALLDIPEGEDLSFNEGSTSPPAGRLHHHPRL